MRLLRVVHVATLTLGIWASFASAMAEQRGEKVSSPAIATAVASAGDAAGPQGTTATYGDWLLSCQKIEQKDKARQVCEISHTVMIQGQNSPILKIAMGQPAPSSSYSFAVALPTNVDLLTAPAVFLEGKDSAILTTKWIRCLPGGCIAVADLAGDGRGLPMDLEKATVRFKDASGSDLIIPISFKGLKASFEALKKSS